MWDAQGRAYLDCIGTIGSGNVGHCHPRVVAAIAAQAQELLLCSEIFYSEPRARLREARRLLLMVSAGVPLLAVLILVAF